MLSLSIPKLCTHSPSSYGVYTLQAHVRFNIFQIFIGDNFFHTFTLHTCFSVHSPYSYLVYSPSTCQIQNSLIFRGFHFFHTYTLHTCFSMQLFLHSPNRCYFRIFIYLIFSMLTLCTHVLVFHSPVCRADVLFTLQAHIRCQFFLIFTGFHFSHAYILQACSSVKSLSNVIIISSCALLNAPLNHECLTP